MVLTVLVRRTLKGSVLMNKFNTEVRTRMYAAPTHIKGIVAAQECLEVLRAPPAMREFKGLTEYYFYYVMIRDLLNGDPVRDYMNRFPDTLSLLQGGDPTEVRCIDE